ncbi:MAG: PASTA domain-containing protein [Nitrospiraceae bacterium]|nr:PASTA domain-containing protein [Nitrospiraceae bacterium]
METPSIVNLKVDDAEKVAEKAGLILQVVSSEYSESVPLDCIISQDPASNERIKEGTIIKAVISNGSRNVSVPNLIGKNFSDVLSILQSVGLSPGDISEKEDSSKVGTVLAQDPLQGTILPPGAPVKLTVSLGEFIIMPSVIGMNAEDAKALLLKQGFHLSHVDETDIVNVSGKVVLYQYPMPGLRVRQGIDVRLKISK